MGLRFLHNAEASLRKMYLPGFNVERSEYIQTQTYKTTTSTYSPFALRKQ